LEPALRHALHSEGVLALHGLKPHALDSLCARAGTPLTSGLAAVNPHSAFPIEGVQLATGDGGHYVRVLFPRAARLATLIARAPTSAKSSELRQVCQSTLHRLDSTVKGCSLVPGGGAVQMSIALELLSSRPVDDAYAAALAEALQEVPRALAENAGFNGLAAIEELRHQHIQGNALAAIGPEGAVVAVLLDTHGGAVQDVAYSAQAATTQAVKLVADLLSVDHNYMQDTVPSRSEAPRAGQTRGNMGMAP